MGIAVNQSGGGGDGIELPSQTGNAGKVLTTNGTLVSWGASGAKTIVSANGSVADGASVTITHGTDASNLRRAFFHKKVDKNLTALLLNFEGADNSTTITDESLAIRTVTAAGSAAIKTAQHKFGASSVYINGSSDYLNCGSISLAGDFTVGMWVRFPSIVANYNQFVGGASGTQIFFGTDSNGQDLRFGVAGGSALLSGSFTFAVDTWYYVELNRVSGVIKMYVNGTQVGSSYSSATTYSGTLVLGNNGTGGSYPVHGYIDNAFIMNGTALHSAAFTAPTEAYSISEFYYQPMALDPTISATIRCKFCDSSNANQDTKTTFINNTGGTLSYICGVEI